MLCDQKSLLRQHRDALVAETEYTAQPLDAASVDQLRVHARVDDVHAGPPLRP